jgi:succinate dehydrogenase/fumarate reductase-like Fe-S protein
MFVLKDLVVDMTNFYSQYKTIQPYLQRKEPKTPNVNKFLIFSKNNIIKAWKTEKSLMDYTSVCFVLVVPHLALLIGGILMSILVQLC